MRLSSKSNDRGFREFMKVVGRGMVPDVFVNGEKVDLVHTADTDLGFAYQYVKDEATGKFIIDGDRVRTRCLSGTVTIVERPRATSIRPNSKGVDR